MGGDSLNITVGESRAVFHVGTYEIGGVNFGQRESGRKSVNFRMGVDNHLRGKNIVEVWKSVQSVTKPLFHVVIATAVVGDYRIDGQLFVLVIVRADFGNGRSEFGASGE